MPRIVEDYRRAAANAIRAGFDGVEVHGANGYLIDQFLRDSINDRSDAYGGSIENRARLLVEVMTAVSKEIGGGRTGVRLSPITPVNGAAQDSNAASLFDHILRHLAPLNLAYVHVIEGQTGGARDLTDKGVAPFDYAAMRAHFKGAWMVNNGYSLQMAQDTLAKGEADLIAFGRPFIANPDLGRRLREGAPLNALVRETLYTPGPAGYTDYPTLA
jgi:N-ethylmaleimide reductase